MKIFILLPSRHLYKNFRAALILALRDCGHEVHWSTKLQRIELTHHWLKENTGINRIDVPVGAQGSNLLRFGLALALFRIHAAAERWKCSFAIR